MTRVVVAMSGGVDSSVVAALLKRQGCEVIGIMLRLWSEPGKEDSNRCCAPDAMMLARRVAARLDIPFYVVDAGEVFRATVVQEFLDGYARGETPNPCLVCNRQIRWGFLWQHALAFGADYLATGHYARRGEANGKAVLLKARDQTKDQSYVLHVLSQEQLQRTLFPVGEYLKSEVRQMAAEWGLPSALRRDSQDLCFLAGEDYRVFLRRYAADIFRPGVVMRRDGQVIGTHSGLPAYTIGQRKGLGVATMTPLYVLAKDAAANALIVGTAEELGQRKAWARAVNWVRGEAPSQPLRVEVKIRYTARPVWAEVTPLDDGSRVRIDFDTPVRDATPGQAAVFYAGEMVLGGGIIEATGNNLPTIHPCHCEPP